MSWKKNLKDILDQAKKSIEENKSEHPTGTLTTTLHDTDVEANLHIQFRYGPQTIF